MRQKPTDLSERLLGAPMKQTNWKENGWHINGGSWKCPKCGTIIGSNLLGEKPFWWAYKHREECTDNAEMEHEGR